MEEERAEQEKARPVDITVPKRGERAEAREAARRARERRPGLPPPGGLIALIPDSILPPESKQHLWIARREMLLAGRSLVRAAVYRLQDSLRMRRPKRIGKEIREELEEE